VVQRSTRCAARVSIVVPGSVEQQSKIRTEALGRRVHSNTCTALGDNSLMTTPRVSTSPVRQARPGKDTKHAAEPIPINDSESSAAAFGGADAARSLGWGPGNHQKIRVHDAELTYIIDCWKTPRTATLQEVNGRSGFLLSGVSPDVEVRGRVNATVDLGGGNGPTRANFPFWRPAYDACAEGGGSAGSS
jgi:hypothetical protein